MADNVTIKLKRSTDYESAKSKTIDFGEPVYLKDKNCVSIGTVDDETIENAPILKTTNAVNINNQNLFLKNDEVVNDSANTIPYKLYDWPIVEVTQTDISNIGANLVIEKTVSGMKTIYNPIASLHIDDTTTSQDIVKAMRKAFGLVYKIETVTGKIKIYFTKTPESAFKIHLLGA